MFEELRVPAVLLVDRDGALDRLLPLPGHSEGALLDGVRPDLPRALLEEGSAFGKGFECVGEAQRLPPELYRLEWDD